MAMAEPRSKKPQGALHPQVWEQKNIVETMEKNMETLVQQTWGKNQQNIETFSRTFEKHGNNGLKYIQKNWTHLTKQIEITWNKKHQKNFAR
jgi:hypothetical protein